MEEDGFIIRTRGAGTYVTRRPKLRNNLDINFGVTDLIRSTGMRPSTEGLTIFDSTATDDEALQLGLAPGAPVKVVERVRLADGRPVVFSRDVIAARIVGSRAEALAGLRDGSIYAWLERELGVVVSQGVASIIPLASPRWLSDRLRIPSRTQLLHLRQVDFDAAGMPVLLSNEYHLANAFDITVLRRGPGPTT